MNRSDTPHASPRRSLQADRQPSRRRHQFRRRNRLRSGLAAVLVAGATAASCAADGSPASAADYGSDPWANYGCDHLSAPRGPGPVYRTLDTIAGGIEKLFGFDKHHTHCDEAACDDACDAAMVHELSGPVEGEIIWPTAPSGGPGGRMMPSVRPSIEMRPGPSMVPAEVEPVPRNGDEPAPDANGDRDGSIFDALPDPFEDDTASRREAAPSLRRLPVMPSGYRARRAGPTAAESRASVKAGDASLRPINETTGPMTLQAPSVEPAPVRPVSSRRTTRSR